MSFKGEKHEILILCKDCSMEVSPINTNQDQGQDIFLRICFYWRSLDRVKACQDQNFLNMIIGQAILNF